MINATSLTRVSDQLRTSTALQSMSSTQAQLLTVENQISTGKRVSTPSDDPEAAAIIQQLNKTLQQRTGFSANLDQANSSLSEADSTLGSLSDLLQQAQNIASQNVNSDVTADQRTSAAAVVQTLADQALTIGNTQFEGAYLFGGDRSTTAPYVDDNGSVKFVGSDTVLENAVDTRSSIVIGVSAADAFGAPGPKVAGGALSPNATATTRLADLGGATNQGVRLGSIKVGDGTGTAVIDLTAADNLGDVAADINAAGLTGVTASVGANGLVLAGPGDVTVDEVGGASTASDLGILTPTSAGPGAGVAGANVNAKVTPLTALADLNAGAGIDASGVTLTVNGTATAVSFAGLATVQDAVNAINSSKAGVTAKVNADGTGIGVTDPTQGDSLAVSENGGTSAADLKIQSTTASTLLASLNGGKGVGTVSGPDLQVTRKDGSTFSVDVDGAKTIQDVVTAINAADGGAGVTASFDAATNGIVLTDATGGAGTLAVSPLNASTAAKDLGLLDATASGSTLAGKDVNPVTSGGVFGDLRKLQKALTGNDVQGITDAAQALQADYSRAVVARGVNGAHLKDVQSRQTRLADQNVATQSFLSDLQDTDFTTAVTKFQTLQTALQASYQTTSKILGMSLMDFLR